MDERNDSTRVESASTPRGVSAPMGSAIPDRDTRWRKRETQRRRGRQRGGGREAKCRRKTERFEEARDRGGREDLRNPLSSSENPRREAHCRRCADKPRSILLARVSLFLASFSQETVKLTSPFTLRNFPLPSALSLALALPPCLTLPTQRRARTHARTISHRGVHAHGGGRAHNHRAHKHTGTNTNTHVIRPYTTRQLRGRCRRAHNTNSKTKGTRGRIEREGGSTRR